MTVCPRCGCGEVHKVGGPRCLGLRKMKPCRERSPILHSGHSWDRMNLQARTVVATYWCEGNG